ncbi:MAG: hypothetical protein NC548_26125 [Lachnospiraceae bacterium]|nr:hypothetical protein [Lachnospiraceae bacterium]
MVNGRVITTKDYMNAVITTLQHNGNNPMTVSQIIEWAADHKLMDKKNASRKATVHPLYKIMSNMIYDTPNPVIDRQQNMNGIYEYQLKDIEVLYINGVRYERLHDGSYDIVED